MKWLLTCVRTLIGIRTKPDHSNTSEEQFCFWPYRTIIRNTVPTLITMKWPITFVRALIGIKTNPHHGNASEAQFRFWSYRAVEKKHSSKANYNEVTYNLCPCSNRLGELQAPPRISQHNLHVCKQSAWILQLQIMWQVIGSSACAREREDILTEDCPQKFRLSNPSLFHRTNGVGKNVKECEGRRAHQNTDECLTNHRRRLTARTGALNTGWRARLTG